MRRVCRILVLVPYALVAEGSVHGWHYGWLLLFVACANVLGYAEGAVA